MPASIAVAARELGRLLAGADPSLVEGTDAAALAEILATAGKQCATASARFAARAAECHAHRGRGFADATDWMARMTGSTRAQAKEALAAAAVVEGSGTTLAAVVEGEVSLAQAAEIARTEAARPGIESELLALAKRSNLSTLREQARERRLEVVDRDELYTRQREARSGVHWVDGAGMVWAKVGLTPEVGVAFVNRWDAVTDRIWRMAARGGSPITREQAAADAFVALVTGEAKPGRGHAEVVAVIDIGALRRGHTHDGERSHVIGGGPVPPAVVRELVEGDAFVKAVVVDGTDITTVRHFGRHIPAELRTALLLGSAPALRGAMCSEESCGRRYGLEIDHERPYAAGGETTLANLDWKCRGDHAEKSRRERAAGLYDRNAWEPP